MTTNEAIDKFLALYVPENTRERARDVLVLLVDMAQTRARVDEVRVMMRGPTEPT